MGTCGKLNTYEANGGATPVSLTIAFGRKDQTEGASRKSTLQSRLNQEKSTRLNLLPSCKRRKLRALEQNLESSPHHLRGIVCAVHRPGPGRKASANGLINVYH